VVWDEPKQLEMAKFKRLDAMTDVAADDPIIKGMPVNECLWVGACKRNPDGTVCKYNARCCGRGDLDKGKLSLTSNDCTSPVARNSSNLLQHGAPGDDGARGCRVVVIGMPTAYVAPICKRKKSIVQIAVLVEREPVRWLQRDVLSL
jgi:hypothetical protein